MIKAIGKKLALLVIFIILMVPTLLLSVLGTETGTRWLIRQVTNITSLGVSVETVEGTLLKQVTLKKIHYRSATERMTLDTFSFSWDASALLSWTLHIRSIASSNLELEILAASSEAPDDAAFSMPEIPLNIVIDAIDMQHLRYIDKETETVVDRIQLAAQLQNRNLRLIRLDLEMPELSARSQGEVKLTQDLPMTAQLNWVLRLPESPEITGTTEVRGDLEKLILNGAIGGAIILEHKATVLSATHQPVINFSGHWQKLQWPLSVPAQISSQKGSLNLSGTPENYRIGIDTQLTAEQLSPFVLTLEGQGDTESLNIKALELQPQQGQLILNGLVSWADGIGFDLAMTANQLNPGNFIKDAPGSLNLQAKVSGQVIAGRISGNADIKQLDGKFRGYPVKASGKLSLDREQLQVDKLIVQSAKNQLSVNGQINPQKAHLQFRIDAPNLVSVWPGLAGSIKGQGSMQGSYQNPVIITQLTADNLSFQNDSIQHLKLDLDYAEALSRPSTIDFQGQQLRLSGQAIERISLEGSGSIKQHQFKANIRSAEIQADLGILGSFENKRWDGTIDRLTLISQQMHRWQLADPWPISLNQQAKGVVIDLPTGCLIQDEASVCLSLNGLVADQLKAQADIRGIDLALFAPWLPEDLSLAGTLSAEAEMLKLGEAITARMQLHIPEILAKVEHPNEPTLSIPLHDTRFDARFQQDRLTAHARSSLGGPDFFSAQIDVSPQERQKPRSLSGTIQASVTDMSFIDALVPEIEKLKGKFGVDLIISGNSEHPVVSGECSLREGGMALPLAGITLKNIDLQLTSDKQNAEEFVLKGHADSGKGALDLSGTLNLNEKQGFPVRIQVVGNNFEIAKLPQAEIAVSPKLLVKQQHNRTEISGDVTVGKASLKLTELPESAVTPSEDETIVGANATAAPKKAVPQMLTDINIMLGNDIHFSGYGLTTQLKGKLRYTSTAKQQRMQGQVAMSDAKYKAYGQDLTVTQGEFLFNGPPDNPWLNIEATRKASGENVTAILKVTGPLKSPETKVSSKPSLPESEALAYLLTGSSLQNVSESQSGALSKAAFKYGVGQLSWLSDQMGVDEFEVEDNGSLKDTSVKLGKYLNPNLYIGFSLGFFSNNYAAIFKQKLSEHFSLQTQAGESQRIELKYQLDTD